MDLILIDPPYGTVKNIGNSENINFGMKNKTLWDDAIHPVQLFKIANRILRKNGRLIMFSQEPYTSDSINQANPNLPFCYRMIWEKDHFANALIAKKAPVSYYEDILVFTKQYDLENLHPLREYFKKVKEFIGLNLKQINTKLGNRKAEHSFYIKSTQFELCTPETYLELVREFNICDMEGFLTYDELKTIEATFKATFNLPDGEKFKSNIFKYKKPYGNLHPTQKPVDLLKDLIITYSNVGDLVVDLTMGSGSTIIAAKETHRKYVGIEMDEKYFKIAQKRVS